MNIQADFTRIVLQLLGVVLCSSIATSTASAQVIDLKNDGFNDGATAGYQSGFAIGEIAASRFVAPGTGFRLNQINLLFGNSGSAQTVTIHVYEDSAGVNSPGTLIYSGDVQLTPTNLTLVGIDVAGLNIIVPQQFRIGIEFQHAGLPSVARDADGTINADRNFINAVGLGWVRSQTLGLTGDWVIRATVEDVRPNEIFGNGFED